MCGGRRASKRGRSGRKGERTFRMSMLLVATQRRRGRPRLLYSNLIHLCLSSGIVIPPLSPSPSPLLLPFFPSPNGNSIREGGRESVLDPITLFCLHSKRFFLSSSPRHWSAHRSFSFFDVPRSTWNALQYRHDVKNRVGLGEFTQLHPSTTRDTGVARKRLDII